MEFVSLLGLLLPTSLSSDTVFLSPSDLPVIILRALGEDVWSGVTWRPLTSLSALSPHSAWLTAFAVSPAATTVLVATSIGQQWPLVREHSPGAMAANPHDHPEKCVV